jgi:hypothetical protein
MSGQAVIKVASFHIESSMENLDNNIDYDAENDANDDHGSERQVKGEIFFPNGHVTWKPA